jgi:hypothetical protein
VIKVEVKPRKDDRYDVYVTFNEADEPFVNSSQGYENVEDAERAAYRAFASLSVWSRVVGVAPDFTEPEPIVMVTTYRTGKTRTEQIR